MVGALLPQCTGWLFEELERVKQRGGGGEEGEREREGEKVGREGEGGMPQSSSVPTTPVGGLRKDGDTPVRSRVVNSARGVSNRSGEVSTGYITPEKGRGSVSSVLSSPLVGYTVSVCCLEIYNERVRYLGSQRGSKQRVKPPVASPSKIGTSSQVYAAGHSDGNAQYVSVSSAAELQDVITKSHERRITDATRVNESSSRSHFLAFVAITSFHCSATTCGTSLDGSLADPEVVHRVLTFVDLAGSEKVSRSLAEGTQLDEAKYINLSLLTLGRVIAALSASNTTPRKRTHHCPFRESKLTRLLQPSLGGNAHTTLVLCVSSNESDISETLSTLRFGSTARNVKNRISVASVPTIQSLLTQLSCARKEIHRLELENKVLRMHAKDMFRVDVDEAEATLGQADFKSEASSPANSEVTRDSDVPLTEPEAEPSTTQEFPENKESDLLLEHNQEICNLRVQLRKAEQRNALLSDRTHMLQFKLQVCDAMIRVRNKWIQRHGNGQQATLK